MELNEQQVERIVQRVLSQMGDAGPAPAGDLPKTGHVAMLTALKKFEVKEFPIPPLGDDDILVKVEGCGVCGTDVHEWRADPFGLIPVTLGHEGTGEIIAMGKNVTTDTEGNPLKVGDKLVTSVTSCGECGICRMHPATTNLCDEQGVFGLIGDQPDYHLNGWFSDYLVIARKGATYFRVNELDLQERMLLEVAAVCVHALERGQKTGLLNFNSKVLLQGCGPVGLMMLCVLRAAGINHIIALDGTPARLELAKELGAKTTINFKEADTLEKQVEAVKAVTNGMGADFVYQCTGVPAAAKDAYEYIRRGGGLCEMGFFVNNGAFEMNPHFALCNKEINLVGSWDYTAQDYPTTIAFLKQAREMNIPIKKLITHTFPLDQLNEAMETNVSQKGVKICYVAK